VRRSAEGEQMADNATVNIPNDVLTPIIQAKVVEALGGQGILLQQLVHAVLDRKVRDEGGYRDIPLVEAAAKGAVREAVKAAVQEWVEQNKPAIQALVEADIGRRKKSIAKALVDGFAKTSASAYRLNVNVALKEDDD
jgi:hypothetical protein